MTPSLKAYRHPDATALHWTVSRDQAARADIHLTLRVPRLSRQKAQSIIRAGDFLRQDEPLRASSRLRTGDIVTLWRISPDRPVDAPRVIDVIHRDKDLLVLDKPADLAMHPSARYLYRTLTQWLKTNAPKANPCHRLDRETSGIVVCAKNKETEARVKTGFQRQAHQKFYVAVTEGCLPEKCERQSRLGLQGNAGLVRIRMVETPHGQAAHTLFERVFFCEKTKRSLVLCIPKSGRQHQIRAHLHALGHPIIGDKLYQKGDAFFDAFTRGEADLSSLSIARHALHAHAIRLEDGAYFSCPIPKDMNALMETDLNAQVALYLQARTRMLTQD